MLTPQELLRGSAHAVSTVKGQSRDLIWAHLTPHLALPTLPTPLARSLSGLGFPTLAHAGPGLCGSPLQLEVLAGTFPAPS